MSAELYAFPDRREVRSNFKEGSLASFMAANISAEAALTRLRRIDWRHPVLIVYREDGDDRWSYVTLGLNSPELGEGDG